MICLDIETSGLDADYCKITAIGICDEKGMKIWADKEEKELLVWFSAWLAQQRGEVYTYNGEKFDLPFIQRRAEIYGVYIDFSKLKHFDLMKYTQKVTGMRNSKDYVFNKIANIYIPKNASGLFLAREFSNGANGNVKAQMLMHNAIDLAATWMFVDYISRFKDFQEWKGEVSAC